MEQQQIPFEGSVSTASPDGSTPTSPRKKKKKNPRKSKQKVLVTYDELTIRERLVKVDEKTAFTDSYHEVMSASSAFARLSPNIPTALLEVTRHIHGRFDRAATCLTRAANTRDRDIKLLNLNEAKDCLFDQYTSFAYLVSTASLSIGAANTVLSGLKECYSQVGKWHSFVLRDKASETDEPHTKSESGIVSAPSDTVSEK